MNKSIAILKDSLREAWDSKTLLVMLVLAFLFLIVISSIGYTDSRPQEMFENYANELSTPMIIIDRGAKRFPAPGGSRPLATYKVTSFKVLKDSNHAAKGEYEITIAVTPGKTDGLEQQPEPTAPPPNKVEPGKEPAKAKEPAKDIERTADGFETAVALWHEDGSGKYVKVEGKNQLDPKKVKVRIGAVTDEMIKDFFNSELERSTQVPITALERIESEDPEQRAFRIRTGPSSEQRVWPVKLSLLFGLYQSETPLPLGVVLYLIQDIVISSVGGMIIILIAVIVTSFFIPNMLRPGSVVMLLSKPVNRASLLLLKYFGGLFFVAILSAFVVGGVWLITGIRAGVWAPGIFAVVPLMTFSFAILYAVSTAAAVLTRNAIVSILVTIAFGGFLWLVGKVESVASVFRVQADFVAELKNEPAEYPVWTSVSGAFNRVLPRWHDIDVLTGNTVRDSLMTVKQQEQRGARVVEKHTPSWGGTVGVTMCWIVAFLGFSIWRFTVKDY